MPLEIIGPSLYSTRGTVFEPQVATVFPDTQTLVTEGTTHMGHREVCCERLEQARRTAKDKPAEPLTADERSAIWESGVDLVVQADAVLIRPDSEQIERALRADELLQEIVNKRRIRFQLARNDRLFEVLLERGELWRIVSDAVTTDEMMTRIRKSRMKLEGRAIYYYSPVTGTRFVTLHEFRILGELSAAELHQHLTEIQAYRRGNRNKVGFEVDFFLGGPQLRAAFCDLCLPADDEEALRAEHGRLCRMFEETVSSRLRLDAPSAESWRDAMYGALYPLQDGIVDSHERLGLAPEFRKHVQWLPGGRMRKGHWDFDSVYDYRNQMGPGVLERQELRAKAIILNYVRDYGDLEHINVGWINESLSRAGRPERGRRDVYVVVMKRASEERRQIHMLRMQKWDMTFRLDRHRTVETAMFETEDYTEYTQDRYLGCRQLGMNLYSPVQSGKISERYQGTEKDLEGTPIWTHYFERPYVPGIASDKITKDQLSRPGYAARVAELLGQAAASNLIVGRGDGEREEICDEKLVVFFDDGDEVIVERERMAESLVVTHHTGSFWHYDQPLRRFADAYARPVTQRRGTLPDPAAFARIYLESLIDRFTSIQGEYREEPHAFDQLFHLRNVRNEGNFAHRWQCVLKRLKTTDPAELKEAIAESLRRGGCLP